MKIDRCDQDTFFVTKIIFSIYSWKLWGAIRGDVWGVLAAIVTCKSKFHNLLWAFHPRVAL
jgi:hypothetical protein